MLAWTSSRTPRSSIGTTLTTYPRPTPYGRACSDCSAVAVGPQGLAQHRFAQLAAEARQGLEGGAGLGPRLRVALLDPAA